MNNIKGWNDAELAMAEYARVSAELDLAQAKEAIEITRVRALFTRQFEQLAADIKLLKHDLTKFSRAHKKEFKVREEGGETRSIEHAGVVMGYRLDPPKVCIEEEEDGDVVDWLIRAGYGDEYVRTQVEPNRQAIRELLNNDADPLVEKFAAHGITKKQEDRFFLEILEEK